MERAGGEEGMESRWGEGGGLMRYKTSTNMYKT